ncbi:hypothetical protein DM01DRAFT_1341026, partial [Hesseltinella vesiculosa]
MIDKKNSPRDIHILHITLWYYVIVISYVIWTTCTILYDVVYNIPVLCIIHKTVFDDTGITM